MTIGNSSDAVYFVLGVIDWPRRGCEKGLALDVAVCGVGVLRRRWRLAGIMKRFTRRDWLIVNFVVFLGISFLLIGAYSVQSAPQPPLQVGPLVPASAEEERQWQFDNLADTMAATR